MELLPNNEGRFHFCYQGVVNIYPTIFCAVCFNFVASNDDSVLSHMVQFTLKDGEIITTIEEI